MRPAPAAAPSPSDEPRHSRAQSPTWPRKWPSRPTTATPSTSTPSARSSTSWSTARRRSRRARSARDTFPIPSSTAAAKSSRRTSWRSWRASSAATSTSASPSTPPSAPHFWWTPTGMRCATPPRTAAAGRAASSHRLPPPPLTFLILPRPPLPGWRTRSCLLPGVGGLNSRHPPLRRRRLSPGGDPATSRRRRPRLPRWAGCRRRFIRGRSRRRIVRRRYRGFWTLTSM
mmetsp:Transcript_10523/g.27619  ORF Transcript_10523/g.27619 Transcript_10523/m.27619 type:complete len:230 (+) Transcript_10523:623-1312(+)